MKNIIEENNHKIKKIIKNYTGEYNEDIEQEVYIRTHLNLDKYREENKFSQWICTIAANLCRDYLRSAKFRNQAKNIYDDSKLENIKAKDTPEKIYSQKERQKIILKEVNKLPSKIKKTLTMNIYEDYSYEQIANKLKIPIGTVKSRINTGKKLLKPRLEFLIKEENL